MSRDFDAASFSSFVSSRRSTRDFLSTPVSDEIIEEIIADGLTSPSWSNTRPILVAVAKDDVRDRRRSTTTRWCSPGSRSDFAMGDRRRSTTTGWFNPDRPRC